MITESYSISFLGLDPEHYTAEKIDITYFEQI